MFKGLMRYYQIWKFRRAKKEADYLHEVTGKRYFVMRLMNKYYVLNSDDIKALKKTGVFKTDLTIFELFEASVYHTQ